MREFWRAVVNFFVEALSEEPALVPIEAEARAQLQRRLQHLHKR
jgi:hypothetical protein